MMKKHILIHQGIARFALMLLLVVLERRAGVRTGDKDVYTNIVGGIRADDRGADLAVALAVAGSVYDKRLPERTAVIGEISLTGEIRPVDHMHNRAVECVRRGYSSIIAPYSSGLKSVEGADIHTVRSLREAVMHLV